MATTAQKSTQIANTVADPLVRNYVADDAKLRLARFDFTQSGAGDAGSTIDLVKFGAGRIRIIPGLSYIKGTAFDATATMDVGHTGYTELDGTTVAASANCIEDNLSVAAAFAAYLGVGTGAAANVTGILIESKGDILIQGVTAAAGIPDGAVVSGWIAYVRD